MLMSRMTVKGQATIPASIREKLGLKAGDSVVFDTDGDVVRIRKAGLADKGFLALSEAAFADWATPEADEAFRDL